MKSDSIKIGVVKAGCIATLPLLEFLFDERADRIDVDFIVSGSGSKLGPNQCKRAVNQILDQNPGLIILVGPAQAAPGPKLARKKLSESGIPTIVISDSPAKSLVKDFEKFSMGYIIIEADSMIGARREFLDPIEMILYNSDTMKVLALTGAFNVVINVIDGIIDSIKKGGDYSLPKIIIDKDKAVKNAGYNNPYARAKAIASYEIAKQAASLNIEGCFREKEWTRYIPLVTAGHEMMRTAAKLVDEAREIEKSDNSVLRTPHHKDGKIGEKRELMEKPTRV